jgi:hypothetical protein
MTNVIVLEKFRVPNGPIYLPNQMIALDDAIAKWAWKQGFVMPRAKKDMTRPTVDKQIKAPEVRKAMT